MRCAVKNKLYPETRGVPFGICFFFLAGRTREMIFPNGTPQRADGSNERSLALSCSIQTAQIGSKKSQCNNYSDCAKCDEWAGRFWAVFHVFQDVDFAEWQFSYPFTTSLFSSNRLYRNVRMGGLCRMQGGVFGKGDLFTEVSSKSVLSASWAPFGPEKSPATPDQLARDWRVSVWSNKVKFRRNSRRSMS